MRHAARCKHCDCAALVTYRRAKTRCSSSQRLTWIVESWTSFVTNSSPLFEVYLNSVLGFLFSVLRQPTHEAASLSCGEHADGCLATVISHLFTVFDCSGVIVGHSINCWSTSRRWRRSARFFLCFSYFYYFFLSFNRAVSSVSQMAPQPPSSPAGDKRGKRARAFTSLSPPISQVSHLICIGRASAKGSPSSGTTTATSPPASSSATPTAPPIFSPTGGSLKSFRASTAGGAEHPSAAQRAWDGAWKSAIGK